MTRENVEVKGRRLLAEGRVVLEQIDDRTIRANVRGSGELHQAGYSPGGWYCTCETRGKCSHLVALQLVTVAPPKRRAL